MLHQLLFDATDADTIHASANVGAYLRSADGTLLTHTDVGGKKALDVRVVDATSLDIRDLVAATDSISAHLKDGSGNSISSTAGALNVNIASGSTDAALANSAIKAVAETVGTTAALIVDGADELASRKYLFVYNNGSRKAYIGESGVTVSSGFPIPPGSILEARIGAAVDVYMIADAAGQNVRTLQAA